MSSSDATGRAPIATPVDARVIIEALEEAGATHIVIVPDTHQKTVLDLLDDHPLPVIRATTEDDVMGICAGLWMTGARPIALIQQLGLFASVNALRAFTHDQGVPLAILAGLYGRDVESSVSEDGASAVRLCTPLLDALDIDWVLVESVDQADRIAPALAAAFDGPRSSAVLLGAPTG